MRALHNAGDEYVTSTSSSLSKCTEASSAQLRCIARVSDQEHKISTGTTVHIPLLTPELHDATRSRRTFGVSLLLDEPLQFGLKLLLHLLGRVGVDYTQARKAPQAIQTVKSISLVFLDRSRLLGRVSPYTLSFHSDTPASPTPVYPNTSALPTHVIFSGGKRREKTRLNTSTVATHAAVELVCCFKDHGKI